MELERELIRKRLSDPDLKKLIETTDGFNDHKNAESSVKAREAGNTLYAQKNHNHEIMETNLNFYSMSICYAPAASEEMALGYANRSALLLHLKRYHGSIADIHRALSITNSPSLKVKLLCRKVDCLIALGLPEDTAMFEKAVEFFNKIDEKDETKKKLQNLLARTKNELDSKQLIVKSNTSGLVNQKKEEKINYYNSISIASSKKYGRHLIATQHIQPGEIVYVEKPYVVCPGSEKLYINCSHCLAIAWNGIPCKHCNWCIFCSSKCRKEAWSKYHFIECSVVTRMIKLNRSFSQNFQMSLRAVIMGLRENGGIAKLETEVVSMNAREGNLRNFFL